MGARRGGVFKEKKNQWLEIYRNSLVTKPSRQGQQEKTFLEVGCPELPLSSVETHERSPPKGIWASQNAGVLSITPRPWAGPAAETGHLTAQSLNFGILEFYERFQSTFESL